MGRPPKAEEDRQSISFHVMISPKEERELRRLARRAGKTVGEWVRQESIYKHLVGQEAGE